MPKKPRFKPEITRVKLNPEQAVLACQCYIGIVWTGSTQWILAPPILEQYCSAGGKELYVKEAGCLGWISGSHESNVFAAAVGWS